MTLDDSIKDRAWESRVRRNTRFQRLRLLGEAFEDEIDAYAEEPTFMQERELGENGSTYLIAQFLRADYMLTTSESAKFLHLAGTFLTLMAIKSDIGTLPILTYLDMVDAGSDVDILNKALHCVLDAPRKSLVEEYESITSRLYDAKVRRDFSRYLKERKAEKLDLALR